MNNLGYLYSGIAVFVLLVFYILGRKSKSDSILHETHVKRNASTVTQDITKQPGISSFQVFDSSGRVDGRSVFNGSGISIGWIQGEWIYGGSGGTIGSVRNQNVYNGSGFTIGRYNGEYLYGPSGGLAGMISGERILVNGSPALRFSGNPTQEDMLIFFYFFYGK